MTTDATTAAAAAGVAALARRITEALALDDPPVGLAFVESAPDGVPVFDGVVPSACSFWREARSGTFFASAAQHANCAVGSHVMGFPAAPAVQSALQEAIETMGACGYLGADEPARIPTVGRPSAGIVYGPLADLPVAADVVVCWLQPSQAMLLQEAAGEVDWTNATRRGLFGRPGCAALPLAIADGRTALSAGCTGMRIFTEVGADRLLAVLAGADLEATTARLEGARRANETMAAYYDGRRRGLEGAVTGA
ncbi:MAG: DUF169 domain-containing protein [Actinomycetota bacterium]|nr:DUF169 domain-containing protein [Actinomycetota bacterium]